MHVPFGARGWLVVTLCALACGGSKPGAPRSALAEKASAPPVVVADTSPTQVAAPEDLVFVGRVARPDALARTVGHWIKMPLGLRMLDALEPGLGSVIAPDAPIEIAATLPRSEDGDEEPEVVVSIGLSRPEDARHLLEARFGHDEQEIEPGIQAVSLGDRGLCAIAPALGRASNRLVCGTHANALRHLLAFATRGLPLLALGSKDIHLEVRVSRLAESYRQYMIDALGWGSALGAGNPATGNEQLDSAVNTLLQTTSSEMINLVDDLQSVALDLELSDGPNAIVGTFTIQCKSANSRFARRLALGKNRMLTAPAAFFDLPSDAHAAMYAVGYDPETTRAVTASMLAFADGFLTLASVPSGLKGDVLRALDSLGEAPATTVLALGSGLDAGSADDAEGPPWVLFGIGDSAGRWTRALDAMARLSSDPAFNRFARKVLENQASSPQSNSGRGATNKRVGVGAWSLLSRRTLKGMGPADRAYSLALEGPDTEGRSGRQWLLTVSDDATTWVGFGPDEHVLLERLAQVRHGAQSPNLGQVPTVESMRQRTALAAGYVSIRSLIDLARLFRPLTGKRSSPTLAVFGASPSLGSSKIVMRAQAAGEVNAPRLLLTFEIPRATVDDISAALPALLPVF